VSRRSFRILGLVSIAALTVWALARERSGPGTRPQPAAARPSPVAATPSVSPAPARPARNVFRFADEIPVDRGSTARGIEARPADDPTGPVPETGPRLVGVVRRGGRTLAALAQGGEVELAAAGESAAGVVVVEIGDEGVRVRRRDGTETVLPLP
jgi:hypothetical protein